MKKTIVSVRVKGDLGKWYDTLENKSDHVREALRMYIKATGINIENYQTKEMKPKIIKWTFPDRR